MAAVLGLAVTALVVDKVVLGGGATESLAAEAPIAAPTAAAPSEAAQAAAAVESVTAQLAAMDSRLRLSDSTGAQFSDAFAPPKALADILAAEESRRKLQERQSKFAEQTKKLREELRLTATSTRGESRAMINGTMYLLGSELPGTGFRVKEIDRAGVLLEDTLTQDTVRVELHQDREQGYGSPKAK